MGRPLVLVIRENDRFSEKLRDCGCRVVNLPLTQTEVLTDLSDLRSKLEKIAAYDGLIFTSPVAAEVFVSLIGGHGLRGKVYALGHRARAVFEDAGIPVEQNGRANTAGELVKNFGSDEFAGKKYLFIRGDRSMRTIPETLSGIAEVEEVVVYRTVEIPPADEEFRIEGDVDWICFFSPSGVDAFSKNFSRTEFNGAQVAAIGKTTAGAAAETGFKICYISETADANEFANGLIGHIKSLE